MSNVMFALAAAMLATTASAQAADPREQPAPYATETTTSPVAKAPRYCVKDTPTGTRLQKKTCKTRDEWMAEGWDPTKPD